MTLPAIVLNGRFLGRPITGVDRVATEIARAIGHILVTTGQTGNYEVVVPPGTPLERAQLGEDASACRTIGSRSGHGWEQTTLARYRRDAWLLNLCNTGPMFRRRQAVMIHDAQFIEIPDSYSWSFRTWYRILLRTLARRSLIVYTNSVASRDALERHGVVPLGKARILPLGVDHLDRFTADDTVLSRHRLRPGGYVLAIGSLARHKNLPMLVKAFLAANLDDIRLVVAGGGNSGIFRDAGLPIAANVDYLGRVSDGELKALYANAMTFACPSITEGFGLPPLEAMRSGCPVIATTGGAVPEVCGDAALYADPTDPVAWRAALVRIAGDGALRAGMADRSRARAADFTWAKAASQILTDVTSVGR